MIERRNLYHRLRRDKSGTPTASSFEMFRCGHCPHIHIGLKDEDGKVFAVMVIDNDQAMAIGAEGFDPTPPEECTQ